MVELKPKDSEPSKQAELLLPGAKQLVSPTEYKSQANGVRVEVDEKFITIDIKALIAEHVGMFRRSDYVRIKFRKDGTGAPDITGFNQSLPVG